VEFALQHSGFTAKQLHQFSNSHTGWIAMRVHDLEHSAKTLVLLTFIVVMHREGTIPNAYIAQNDTNYQKISSKQI